MNFRKANINDLESLKQLGLKSWEQFKHELTSDNWNSLYKTINNIGVYSNLLENSDCIICESNNQEIIGMAFLVPKGNPTEIYNEEWCHLRFVSVDPNYRGNGIGKKLTELCIKVALENNEQTMALHTSEIMGSARRIYEKIGFKIVKEIEPRLGVKYWLYTLELKKQS
ncbi:GNAT family N-acetyltransferase [Tenacibaculum xiamenense]|uniref:GNAT family N-acetyltransferase n=1 Tax=Tenacibaculum xiamenense TaxID=1261553 RepID=UPI0038964AF0